MTWSFRKKRRDEKIRNPIQGEFFATDAIEGPAQALVRESVQNSLDACAIGARVQVRVFLANGDCSLPANDVSRLFREAWPHYAAEGNGLQQPPDQNSRCSFLVVEDFGTRGLTGDPLQADPLSGIQNPFYLFFRAEGLSAKGGTELGRWGIGKFVFPRSSQASTHFGVTVRHDDGRRFLMGAVTLKAHRIAGDPELFSPDGLYGTCASDGFVMPIDNPEQIDRFCKLFAVTRKKEPGLSVVIPFVDPEISFEHLLVAAIRDYFLPILDNRLEISVSDGARTISLNTDSLDAVVAEFASELGESMQGYVKLARWKASVPDAARLALPAADPERAAKWSDSLVPPTTMAAIREKLAAKEPIAIRVPVSVREKSKTPVSSWFDIYILSDKASDGRPLFVREGIIISDVRGSRARELRSMVVVEHKPLATMLGDSENPAHTQWQKDSSNFRGKYTYGVGLIDFVSNCVGSLMGILARSAQKAEPSLTVDFFSIDPPDDRIDETEESDRKRKRRVGGEKTEDEEVKAEPRPNSIRVTPVERGFAIQSGSAPPPTPFFIEVRCAYDLRSGNPLKKWNPADFNLSSTGFPIECEHGISVEKVKGNWLLLRVTDSEFAVSVTGFDGVRDVFVRAQVHLGGAEYAGQAA